VRRRVELAKSSVLSGVFLGFEVVTALTNVMACLQIWAFKTGLLKPGCCLLLERTRERERSIYESVHATYRTATRAERAGSNPPTTRLVKGEASFRPKITLHTKQEANKRLATVRTWVAAGINQVGGHVP
jgi:hypothetical protein